MIGQDKKGGNLPPFLSFMFLKFYKFIHIFADTLMIDV